MNKILKIIKDNKDAVIFIIVGFCSIYLFIRYSFYGIEGYFTEEIPGGNAAKKAFFLELILYKIGGYTLIKVFYFTFGCILPIIGVFKLVKKNRKRKFKR